MDDPKRIRLNSTSSVSSRILSCDAETGIQTVREGELAGLDETK